MSYGTIKQLSNNKVIGYTDADMYAARQRREHEKIKGVTDAYASECADVALTFGYEGKVYQRIVKGVGSSTEREAYATELKKRFSSDIQLQHWMASCREKM